MFSAFAPNKSAQQYWRGDENRTHDDLKARRCLGDTSLPHNLAPRRRAGQ